MLSSSVLSYPGSSWNDLTLYSHEWPRQNFFLQYQYNIKQTSDENKEKYQLGDYKIIQYQILHTNITRTVWEIVRRITNEILRVKGLNKVEGHTFET